MKVDPLPSRSVSKRTSVGLEIRFPPPRNIFILLFMSVWLVGWTVGGINAITELVHSDKPLSTQVFLLAWLCGWTLGWVFVVGFILWSLAGEELLILGTQDLILRRSILSIGLTREYTLSHVKNLRFSTFPGGRGGPRQSLAFDYGAKTVRFGGGIDEAEATTVTSQLWTVYPSLRPSGA
jgi:hypothetical protein